MHACITQVVPSWVWSQTYNIHSEQSLNTVQQNLDSTSSAKQSEKVFAGQGSGNITDADRSGQTDMVVQQPSSGELRLCELSQEPWVCGAQRGTERCSHLGTVYDAQP